MNTRPLSISKFVLVILVFICLNAASSFADLASKASGETSFSLSSKAGQPDRTFSGDGKMTDGQIPGWFGMTAVQPDGKIIAVGGGDLRYFYVARYTERGVPDPAFGNGTGKVAVQFGPFYNYPEDVAVQPDGKIIVVGCYCEEDAGDYTLALLRLNPNGSPDNTFGTAGVALFRYLVGPANAVALQPDGKIVVAGQAGFYLDWLVLRFDSDGSPDSTFLGNRNVFEPLHAMPLAVAIQPDGKIIAAGSSTYFEAGGKLALVRYNSDGSLDSSFGQNGIVTTDIGRADDYDYITSMAMQGDGKIVVVGKTNVSDFTVLRYNSNGSLDTAFGDHGIADAGIHAEAQAKTVAIQSDGKIMAAGTLLNGNDTCDFAVVRYLPNGSIDPAFGGAGRVFIDFGGACDGATDMALDNKGRAVIVGESEGKPGIARVLGDVDVPQPTLSDFDRDSRSDLGVFRPSTGTWYVDRSGSTVAAAQWGASGDTIVPADYDGDGKADLAIYRPAEGRWYILNSSNGTSSAVSWGVSTDIPTPADFDNDGKTDIAIFRPSDGTWWISRSTEGIVVSQFGANGDLPVTGDYDADGRADMAVFRPSNATWYLQRSAAGPLAYQFGRGGDKPVPADYDGDGKTDIGVVRPSENRWYIANSSSTTFRVQTFGADDDIPVPGDFDGDGKADIAIFRPSDGTWWIDGTAAGLLVKQFGQNGDTPVEAAYSNRTKR